MQSWSIFKGCGSNGSLNFQNVCSVILLGLPLVSAAAIGAEGVFQDNLLAGMGTPISGGGKSQASRLPMAGYLCGSHSGQWSLEAPITLSGRWESQATWTKRLPQLGQFLQWGPSC